MGQNHMIINVKTSSKSQMDFWKGTCEGIQLLAIIPPMLFKDTKTPFQTNHF